MNDILADNSMSLNMSAVLKDGDDTPLPAWDIGERPTIPMPYIQLPAYEARTACRARMCMHALIHSCAAHHCSCSCAQFVHARQRDREGGYSSKASVTASREPTRQRHEQQRREGQGWRSKLHKALDYRTVDELGLTPDQLNLDRKPTTEPDRLVVVEGKRLREKAESEAGTRELQPGAKVFGEVKEGGCALASPDRPTAQPLTTAPLPPTAPTDRSHRPLLPTAPTDRSHRPREVLH